MPHGIRVGRYIDPAFQQMEYERLWSRVWQVATRIDEIPEVNDFAAFFAAHPRISRVYLTGGAAYALFKKHAGFDFSGIEFARLGSTSPAHAVPFEEKLSEWRRILPLPG